MKINSRSIAILMATYNSAKYLGQQIDSIIEQTTTDWTLYIRDDGSTDSTDAVIEKYESLYPDHIVVLRDNNGNLGCRDNFFALLEAVQSKYYMFSDADDVWLPDKIKVCHEAIRELEKNNPDRPILIHTDLKVVDEDLNEIYPSLWRSVMFNPDKMKRVEYLSIHSYIHGCTTLFNNNVKLASMPFCRDIFLHDLWVGICTLKNNGIIHSIHEPSSLYRQHLLNIVGSPSATDLSMTHKVRNARKVISTNLEVYKMLKKIGYGSFLKYLYYKMKLVWMMRSGKMFE